MENSNKALAVNTVILYIRLVLVTVCGLFTTRFALHALGVVDFGLYSVLGGIVSLISVINTIMLVTSNRFIGVAIGKGDEAEANEQFNVNLRIHIAVAIITLIVLLPLGYLYIIHFVHYDGDIYNAIAVFIISIVGASISFIGVPYNGLLMAKENFIVFSIVDVLSHIIKLLISLSLVYYFSSKLIIYATGMAICSAYPTIVYSSYCRNHYYNLVKWLKKPQKGKIKSVLSFSLWSGYGAVASVAKNQGASLLVNAFFNTVLNAALSIASTVNNYIILFSQNVTKPVSPQLTKNYASANYERSEKLLVFITKTAFLFMLLIATPFLLETEFVLKIWLGDNIPEYSVLFTRLLIVEALIDSLNNGISELVFAYGKIKLYQITTNTAKLFAIIVAYLLLRNGGAAVCLLYSYIGVSIIVFFLKQYSLSKVPNIEHGKLMRNSYIPSLLVVLFVLPIMFLPGVVHPVATIMIAFLYEIITIYFVGLKKSERTMIMSFILKRNNEK